MYAVFETGGQQFRVKKGDVIAINKIEGKVGDPITFDKVLLKGEGSVKIGTPYLSGATVGANIKKQYRNDTILVFKFRRRKNFKKMQGHRQPMTQIQITEV